MRKPYLKPAARKLDLQSAEGKRLLSWVNGSERRRSTRVAVQIPVQAHFRSAQGTPLRTDAYTLVVSAHGCLLAMDIKPPEGQTMRLRNIRSAVEEIGRIVRSQASRDGSFHVALEFDSATSRLWSLLKAPEDWLASKT